MAERTPTARRTCDVCGQPATTRGGIISADLCDNYACHDCACQEHLATRVVAETGWYRIIREGGLLWLDIRRPDAPAAGWHRMPLDRRLPFSEKDARHLGAMLLLAAENPKARPRGRAGWWLHRLHGRAEGMELLLALPLALLMWGLIWGLAEVVCWWLS